VEMNQELTASVRKQS